jgi:hypothetical protein
MQLPRGTFREITKNRKTGDVLRELQHDRFSGICCISCHDEVCTLVIQAGDCVLAEYGTGKGDAALENILHSFGEEDVDAALSSFDEVQIRLSLEFNTAEQVRIAGHRAPQARPSSPGNHHTVLPEHHPEKVHLTPAGQKKQTDPHSAIRTPHAGQGGYEGSPTLHAGAGEEDELFDSMNIEEVTGKLRAECKTLVKNLDLEHLMERDSE